MTLKRKPDTATPLMGEVTQILGDTGQESPASHAAPGNPSMEK